MVSLRELQWTKARNQDPNFDAFIRNYEDTINEVGRKNLPDIMLYELAWWMEKELGAQQFMLRNPEGFFNEVRNPVDRDGDGMAAGGADLEIALIENA